MTINFTFLLSTILFKKAGGRGQRAEGTNWKGIVTPPNRKLPNFRFGRGFIPLLLSVVGRGDIPSASCLLPSAFTGEV